MTVGFLLTSVRIPHWSAKPAHTRQTVLLASHLCVCVCVSVSMGVCVHVLDVTVLPSSP